MKNYFSIIYLSIFYIFLVNIKKSYAIDSTINILVENPDFINEKNRGNITLYEQQINNQINSIGNVRFLFITDESKDKKVDEEYKNYVKEVVTKVDSENSDIFVFDGNFLFSDMSNKYIESDYIHKIIGARKFHEVYTDLTDLVDKNDKFKYPNECYYDDKLYAIPYEREYDVLYYHSNGLTYNLSLDNWTWDTLINLTNAINNKNPLCVALGDDEELLKMFVEYIRTPDSTSFDPDVTKEKVNQFKSFIRNSKVNINSTMEEAYNSFKNNECVFFKGKTSHYKRIIEENPDVKVVATPNNINIINKKYLIFNINSKLKAESQREIIKVLTSDAIQYANSDYLDSVPTLNIPDVRYCTNREDLCNIIKNAKAVLLKDYFETEYSAPYMEVRLLLPQQLRDYILSTDEEKSTSDILDVLENIGKFYFQKNVQRKLKRIIVYIPMVILTLGGVLMMIYTFKYRKHSYLRIYSPSLCIISIFGFIMGILSVLLMTESYTLNQCKVKYIYDNVNASLMLGPLIAISFRIYSIYSNKSRITLGKQLRNKRLFIFLFIFVIGIMVYSFIVVNNLKYYILTTGDITKIRQPSCSFDNKKSYRYFYMGIQSIMFFVMAFTIIITGKVARKYGEIRYIIIMIFVYIVELCMSIFKSIIINSSICKAYMIMYVFYMVSYFACVYMLFGTKLVHSIRNPNGFNNTTYNSDDTIVSPRMVSHDISTKAIPPSSNGNVPSIDSKYFPTSMNSNKSFTYSMNSNNNNSILIHSLSTNGIPINMNSLNNSLNNSSNNNSSNSNINNIPHSKSGRSVSTQNVNNISYY
ncbi:hypothetical protein PIROE2DRAFT_12050 [Piromyces sp. E2]|nr:hypothetical protein PIROE2DRAFT_12050 [Piromyces sp. E2]|eukprot:OUM61846.1 hypothetical protein PIROE2DRAFT_12050 [Piromyces sp. E2]